MGMDGIAAFWAWWPSARDRIMAAIGNRGFDAALTGEIAARVKAIDDSLSWELAPGRRAQHAFCLSPEGNPILRRTTERWLAASPPADSTWEYFPSRPGRRTEMPLAIEGHQLLFSELSVTFEVDATRELLNVTCFHPTFGKMDDRLRMTATLLILDGAFGEDDVERWFGGIAASGVPLDGARPAAALQEAISTLAGSASGERFAILKGADREGRPIVATVNAALKRINHLSRDQHVVIRLALLDPTPQGLTTQVEADDLNAMEDELGALAGSAAVYFGRETARGLRILHFFASDDPPLRQRWADWVARHPERQARVDWRADPQWEAKGRFA